MAIPSRIPVRKRPNTLCPTLPDAAAPLSTSTQNVPPVTRPSETSESPSRSTDDTEISSKTLDDSTAFIQTDPLAKFAAFTSFPSGEQVGGSGTPGDRDQKTARTQTIVERYAHNYFSIEAGRVTFDGAPRSRRADIASFKHQLILTTNTFSVHFSAICAGNETVLADDFAIVLSVGNESVEHRVSKDAQQKLAFCNCRGSVMGDNSSSVQIKLCGTI